MKNFLPILLLLAFRLAAQDGTKTCEKLQRIISLVNREHYSPKPIDDSLSVYVFDTFTDQLDTYRNLITGNEYKHLSAYRLKLDDMIRTGDCSFLDQFASVYRNALERKIALLEKIRNQPLDYNVKDSLRFSRKHFPFDLVESDQERIWKKRLRVEIFEEMSSMTSNLDSLKANFTAIEKIASNKIFESELCKTNSILNDRNGLTANLQSQFLDIFCQYFDPHSNYFTMDAKSSFMSTLSTSNFSLGIDFDFNEKQEVVVADVVPGGPAARSHEFERDDVIISVADADGRGYTLSCASLDAVGELLFSDNNKQVSFTIRKKNGSLHEVTLRKQLMEATGNDVYGFVIEKGIKAGYIKVPNFYSDFDGSEGNGCAADVASEVERLKKDNIDGLIIDLQENGGGSMEEAVKMTGLFIDKGLVTVLSDNRGKQHLMKDDMRGNIYNGPIIILTDGSSASASELFTAALQDYKRAVIIGAPTSGKASMQTLVPLDYSQSDYIKLTIEKFYRVNGKSHQGVGVIPDVAMPVLFDSLVQRESSFETALRNDSIRVRQGYDKWQTQWDASLVQQARQRVKSNADLQEIGSLNQQINSWYRKQKAPLPVTLDAIFADVHENDLLFDRIKRKALTETKLVVKNSTIESGAIASDAFLKEINEYRMKDARQNVYIDEALNMLSDYRHVHKR